MSVVTETFFQRWRERDVCALQHSRCSRHASTPSPLLTSCFTSRLFMSSAKPRGVCSTVRPRIIARPSAAAKMPAIHCHWTGRLSTTEWCLWQITIITIERNWAECQNRLRVPPSSCLPLVVNPCSLHIRELNLGFPEPENPGNVDIFQPQENRVYDSPESRFLISEIIGHFCLSCSKFCV